MPELLIRQSPGLHDAGKGLFIYELNKGKNKFQEKSRQNVDNQL